jgi:hypothetical protein
MKFVSLAMTILGTAFVDAEDKSPLVDADKQPRRGLKNTLVVSIATTTRINMMDVFIILIVPVVVATTTLKTFMDMITGRTDT